MSGTAHYPNPPLKVGSEELLRRTKRQRWQNNFSKQSSPSVVSSALSESGYTTEKWRVGAPPLQLLPLKSMEVDKSSPEHQIFDTLVPNIEEVLESWDIDYYPDGLELV